MPLQTEPYDSVAYLNDSDSIFHYLQAALEDGDAPSIAAALDTAVRAYGLARLAQECDLPYGEVVRALNADNRHHLNSLLKVLDALGVKAPTKHAA